MFFKDNLLPWFFDLIEKTASQNKVYSDIKSINDFSQYFKELSKHDKEKLDELKNRKNQFEVEKQYHDLEKNIFNSYWQKTNLYREFYLHRAIIPKSNYMRYIYCECLMVQKQSTDEKVTLSVFYDCDENGNIKEELMHEDKNMHISNYINDLRKGIKIPNDLQKYYPAGMFQIFSDIEKYVKNKQQ